MAAAVNYVSGSVRARGDGCQGEAGKGRRGGSEPSIFGSSPQGAPPSLEGVMPPFLDDLHAASPLFTFDIPPLPPLPPLVRGKGGLVTIPAQAHAPHFKYCLPLISSEGTVSQKMGRIFQYIIYCWWRRRRG